MLDQHLSSCNALTLHHPDHIATHMHWLNLLSWAVRCCLQRLGRLLSVVWESCTWTSTWSACGESTRSATAAPVSSSTAYCPGARPALNMPTHGYCLVSVDVLQHQLSVHHACTLMFACNRDKLAAMCARHRGVCKPLGAVLQWCPCRLTATSAVPR